jgi:hypothetical protein
MAQAYVPGKFKYILKRDRKLPKDKQTVFFLRAFTSRELEDVEGSLQVGLSISKDGELGEGTVSTGINMGERINAFLRAGLTGWENFPGADGKLIEPVIEESTKQISWESIDNVVPYRMELYTAIEKGNTVTEAEAKNSP